MDTNSFASFELCDELYTLSEWGTPEDGYHWLVPNDGSGPFLDRPYRTIAGRWFTAYLLGYLMRKLREYHHYPTLRFTGFYWICDDGQYGNGSSEDSPENAVAALAIRLIRDGHIKTVVQISEEAE